jgi:predicted  nucleic acid-binding Zn-ribbon protein
VKNTLQFIILISLLVACSFKPPASEKPDNDVELFMSLQKEKQEILTEYSALMKNPSENRSRLKKLDKRTLEINKKLTDLTNSEDVANYLQEESEIEVQSSSHSSIIIDRSKLEEPVVNNTNSAEEGVNEFDVDFEDPFTANNEEFEDPTLEFEKDLYEDIGTEGIQDEDYASRSGEPPAEKAEEDFGF